MAKSGAGSNAGGSRGTRTPDRSMPSGGNRKVGKSGGTGNATFQKGTVSKPFPGEKAGGQKSGVRDGRGL